MSEEEGDLERGRDGEDALALELPDFNYDEYGRDLALEGNLSLQSFTLESSLDEVKHIPRRARVSCIWKQEPIKYLAYFHFLN